MSGQDAFDHLLDDLKQTQSVEDVQMHILVANEVFTQEADVEFGQGTFDIDDMRLRDDSGRLVGRLETWLERLREHLKQVTKRQGAAAFTITVGGSLTGPQISVQVTYEV
jgi:hypothetical protein